MNSLLFVLISFWLWLISFLLMCLVWSIYRNKINVQKIEQLEYDEWSIQYRNQSKIQRAILTNTIDHYFYVVLYFERDKPKNIVIWKDQLDKKAWKKLLIRINLN
ncbi:MAG: hypothetical protein H9855_12430 [Candidatus Acinetobacter avistercoris]|uniref:protein YgfX n=1 Tax=Acinetobacter sp. KS-LM10 TaxID=3120518 RepID=UPI001F92E943|nr:hypothetical protein [Candidatus Acinetobacter avistercoris]